jgi:hypothetical protein
VPLPLNPINGSILTLLCRAVKFICGKNKRVICYNCGILMV